VNPCEKGTMQPFGSRYLFTKLNIDTRKLSSTMFHQGITFGGIDMCGTRRLEGKSPKTNEALSNGGSYKP
jgi:hypothetical protein